MIIRHKKNWIIAILTIFIISIFWTYAYAASEGPQGEAMAIDYKREYRSSRESRVIGAPRGRLISSVELTMTDKGGGTVGIYSDILCHEAMKELRMWLILEKWIPEEEVWESVRVDKFSWEAKDYPDQDLTLAIATYDISGLERGLDYRVSGLFGADSFSAGLSETWSINTPNFFLE